MYNSGDPKSVNKAKQRAYTLEEKFANGIVKICNDPDTRLVLSIFLEQAGIFNSNFHKNPTEHAFNEGFRSGGLWWLNNALLNDKDIIAKMQRDKDNEQKANLDYDGSDTDTSSE